MHLVFHLVVLFVCYPVSMPVAHLLQLLRYAQSRLHEILQAHSQLEEAHVLPLPDTLMVFQLRLMRSQLEVQIENLLGCTSVQLGQALWMLLWRGRWW